MDYKDKLVYLGSLTPIPRKVFPDQKTFSINRHNVINKYISKHKLTPTIVLSTGSYDLLTQYHLQALNTAKKLFSNVIHVVAVDTDTYVKERKGPERPIREYTDRVNTLSMLSYVDYLVPDYGNNEDLIKAVLPNYLIMSNSTVQELPETRQNDIELIHSLSGSVIVFPMITPAKTSTSLIIESVLKKYTKS